MWKSAFELDYFCHDTVNAAVANVTRQLGFLISMLRCKLFFISFSLSFFFYLFPIAFYCFFFFRFSPFFSFLFLLSPFLLYFLFFCNLSTSFLYFLYFFLFIPLFLYLFIFCCMSLSSYGEEVGAVDCDWASDKNTVAMERKKLELLRT